MDQTRLGSRYLTEKLPGICAAKMEGVFIGPQMHQFFRDKQFTAFTVITGRGLGIISSL
jgi:hypothetical protein